MTNLIDQQDQHVGTQLHLHWVYFNVKATGGVLSYPDGSAPTSTTKKGSKEGIPVYEVTENQENPLRCPVKLYEFYLSKWSVELGLNVHIVQCCASVLPYCVLSCIGSLAHSHLFANATVN